AKELGVSMASQSSENSKLMKSIYKEMTLLFKHAIESAFPTIADPPVILNRSEYADFQCNSALKLTKMVPEKKSPVEIAKLIVANFEENDIIDSVTVSGPGF